MSQNLVVMCQICREVSLWLSCDIFQDTVAQCCCGLCEPDLGLAVNFEGIGLQAVGARHLIVVCPFASASRAQVGGRDLQSCA
jgi:hypothetical protein